MYRSLNSQSWKDAEVTDAFTEINLCSTKPTIDNFSVIVRLVVKLKASGSARIPCPSLNADGKGRGDLEPTALHQQFS